MCCLKMRCLVPKRDTPERFSIRSTVPQRPVQVAAKAVDRHRDVFARAERLLAKPEAAERRLSRFLEAHPDQAVGVAQFWRRHNRTYQAVAVLDRALQQDMLAVYEDRGASRPEAMEQSLDFRLAVAAEIQGTLAQA